MSQLVFRRTPFLNQKYDETFGQFMQNLKEQLQQEPKSRFQQEIMKELFMNQITKTEFDNFNLTNQEEIDAFMSHDIRKQIFCIGERIDELTDSYLQNTIYVMENYNLMHFNPAVLAVSYANMKVFDKSKNIFELPRITFIQLGMNEQEMNKKFLYFNGIDRNEKKKNQIMSNIQYINMFHQYDGKSKQNLQKKGYNLNNDQNQHEQPATEFENMDFTIPSTHCFEIAINRFLIDREINDQNSSLQDLFFQDQQKCPKIIGKSEFIYLFDTILKLVRNNKPNIILFAYDFSFTKAHNHYYDLKVDTLGYFAYMLSQISNHHVLFIANTKYDSHINIEQSQQINSILGLDGIKSLNNYMNAQKIEEVNSYTKDQNITQKNFTLLKSTQDRIPDVYIDQSQNQQDQNICEKILNKTISDVPTPDEVLSKYYNYHEEKFNNIKECLDNHQLELIQDESYALEILLHSLNLYECIQDQFFAVCFALLEIINYRKLKQRQNLKIRNHIDFAFQVSLAQQLKIDINSSKYQAQKEFMAQTKEINEWNITQIKKLSKQNKYKEKVNLFMDISEQKGYTVTPKSDKPSKEEIDKANQESLISDMRNQQTSLVEGLSKQQSDRLFTQELKVKIMLKRYQSALLNNWIHDLRRNERIYLNVKVKSTTFDSEFKFFFTDRSQYVIDYDQDKVKIIIYFFNVQRGKVFKNFILTEIRENMFIQEEIVHQTPVIYDFMWKSFMGITNLLELKIQQIDLQEALYLSQNNVQDSKYNQTKIQKEYHLIDSKSTSFYIHQELIENLEIFNSALCLSEKYVVRLFGEIINPSSWKQKEYHLLIFTVPRKQIFQELSENPSMKLVNIELVDTPLIHKSVPRAGCTAVCLQQNEQNLQNIVYVFGGLSYNGFWYNVVEEYKVLNNGSLIQINQRTKLMSSLKKQFRPLFCPFTFIHNQEVYFFGGEYGKKFLQKAFNEYYFQKYSIIDKEFKVVIALSSKDIKQELIIRVHENKNFLSDVQKISYTSTNLNLYKLNNTFNFALIWKINAGIQLIIEKTALISINIDQVISQQHIPGISCRTIIEEEKQQEVCLGDYRSSQTFFISVFSAESSTFGCTQIKDQFPCPKPASMYKVHEYFNIYQKPAQYPKYQTSIGNSINHKQETEKQQQQQQSVQTKYSTKWQKNLPVIQSNQNQQILKPSGGLIKQINDLSQKIDFPNYPDDGGIHGSALNSYYFQPVNKEIHYFAEENVYYPKYILLQRYHNKLLNFISFENNRLIQKFQTSIRINDEDFKDLLLTNNQQFLTYNINFLKKQYTIYKSISLEEAIEINQIFGGRINLTKSLYKSTIKFDQQKLSAIQLQVFEDDLELIQPQLINRNITCDQNYIYLLNGVNYNEQNNISFNKLVPCERISIKNKKSESIDSCIYLDTKKSYIFSNDLYIFYIGIYENLESTEMEEEGNEDVSEILIAQVFSKQINKWKVFQIQNKEIRNNFGNYQFLHGNSVNKIFAINTKYTKSKKDQLINYEISFDFIKTLSTIQTNYISFNWQGQTKISIIPSQFYSATIYTILPTNPIQYSAISMIPVAKTQQ